MASSKIDTWVKKLQIIPKLGPKCFLLQKEKAAKLVALVFQLCLEAIVAMELCIG